MTRFCCLFALILNLSLPVLAQTVTAGFSTVSSVCTNTPVTVQNTSVGASNYYWSFCAADFNATPEAVNLGNPGNLLSSPVFGCYAQDGNGSYYGLVESYTSGDLIRLNFGNSLLNTPTAEDLGTFNGALPEQSEGIQLLHVNGAWTAIMVGGGNQVPNSSPRVVKIDFGSSLANTPAATNWGGIGGLNLPHDLYIGSEGGNFYGFAINVNDNTITRLSFGPDFSNPPTGINLGNIGNIDYPAGLTFVNYNANWYCFIANRVTNSLTRLSFGNSLLNTPVGTNIGNPGGLLDFPRDVSLFSTCEGVYGFVVNEQSNHLVQLNFGTDPTSVPQATDLGNIGQLNFPHSISDLFRVGNDIYAFIPNVTSSTLTRIRFAGCQEIPGSTAQNPPPFSYPNAGTYTINLLVDLGLPTQSSFCRQINVLPSPQGKLTGDTVCYGSSPALSFTGTGTVPFGITYSDGSNRYVLSGLNAQTGIPLPYPITAPGVTAFALQQIMDGTGCVTTTNLPTQVLIDATPQGGITGTTVCGADSARLVLQTTSGVPPFEAQLNNGSVGFTVGGVSPGIPFPAPLLSTPTTFSLTGLADGYGCPASTFNPAAVTITPLPAPVLLFPPLGRVCYDKEPFQITSATETSGLAGSGKYGGSGIDADGDFSPVRAGLGPHKISYTYVADDGCAASDTSLIVVNALPNPEAPPLIIACEGIPVQLAAKGGSTYSWTPAGYLDNPASATPTATVDTTTRFIVEVTDSNGCMAYDTILVEAKVSIRTAFVLPNAFTPNGDGHNDCFGVRQWGEVTIEELAVFNRQGLRVFSTTNPGECWDGSFKGQPQASGGYVYVIKARTPCGELTRTGMVLLIR